MPVLLLLLIGGAVVGYLVLSSPNEEDPAFLPEDDRFPGRRRGKKWKGGPGGGAQRDRGRDVTNFSAPPEKQVPYEGPDLTHGNPIAPPFLGNTTASKQTLDAMGLLKEQNAQLASTEGIWRFPTKKNQLPQPTDRLAAGNTVGGQEREASTSTRPVTKTEYVLQSYIGGVVKNPQTIARAKGIYTAASLRPSAPPQPPPTEGTTSSTQSSGYQYPKKKPRNSGVAFK